MRSGSTGRLRNAICTERKSLSRSNGTRRPLRLITVSSRSCTRSNVVKRKLQARQTRRRRITAESSVGRESFTWVSRLAQLGHRMVHLQATKFGSQPCRNLHTMPAPLLTTGVTLRVNGKPRDQSLHLGADGGFGRVVVLRTLG